VSGTLDSYDTLCRALALRTTRTVVSLAYSLSPEVRHPQALEEVADVIQTLQSPAQGEGLPTAHLTVCGDSAGGHLIAAAMHLLAERGLRLPDAAVLIYPIADVSMHYESYAAFADGYSLTAAKMQWFWSQYLGQQNADENDPLLSPLQSPYLSRFPCTLVITAEFDPLRDEGVRLADRMSEEGAAVEWIDVPGQIHGFMRFRKALPDPEWGPDAIVKRIASFLNQS
jgi:acetyl esterase